MQLVVTSDNKQAPNMGAELAREKLRQDLMQANTEAVTRAAANRAPSLKPCCFVWQS
jgi:hypothetical protein